MIYFDGAVSVVIETCSSRTVMNQLIKKQKLIKSSKKGNSIIENQISGEPYMFITLDSQELNLLSSHQVHVF